MKKSCLSFKIGKPKKSLMYENTFKVGKVRTARQPIHRIKKIK